MKLRHLALAAITGLASLHNTSAIADDMNITLPGFAESTPYFQELVTESLKAAGHEVNVSLLDSKHGMKRVVRLLQTNSNELTMGWFGAGSATAEGLVPVDVDLTNGLKGYRVFFIPKGAQAKYDSVNSLADFRATGLTGGFGKNWFDVRVWAQNGLSTDETDGKWNPAIYRKVKQGNRGVDYFSRGIVEIAAEAPLHPELDVEKRLVFIYDNDFRFYLSQSNAHLKPILEEALSVARDNGLMDQLLRKHFPSVYDPAGLDLDSRVRINLELPGT